VNIGYVEREVLVKVVSKTKAVGQLEVQDATSSTRSKRSLGFWMCTSLVVGNMIGSGIFLLPASLASYGGISLVGWGLTAAGATCLALLFARLASMVPREGGPYAYTRMAFGDFAGFWIGWGHWMSLWIGNAAISVALVSYLQGMFPILSEQRWLSGVVALALLWLITGVNTLGVKDAGIMQVITTICKLVPLLALLVFGFFRVDWQHFVPLNPSGKPPIDAITAVAALTFWSFLGIESATVPAGYVKDPAKTIPRATLLGILITSLVYILSTTVIMGIMPLSRLGHSSAPYAEAAGLLWGSWASYALAIGAVISCLGALNGLMMMAGQVPMAVAQDGLFPRIFGRVSRQGVPVFALVLSSTLASLLLLLNYMGPGNLVEMFSFIILLGTLTSQIPYAFCAIAELILFFTRRDLFNGRRLFGSSMFSILAFVYSVWAIIGAGATTVLYGFVLLLLGLPVYAWIRKQQGEKVEGGTDEEAA
jgi:APA family basic amino acid/polyamine antiporter